MANLEGMKYPHFWGCWEIYWSFEVFASWDIVWVVLYLEFYVSVFDFLQSFFFFFFLMELICCNLFLFPCVFFFCVCFKYSLVIIMNMMYFFINENIYYLSKIEKEKGYVK